MFGAFFFALFAAVFSLTFTVLSWTTEAIYDDASNRLITKTMIFLSTVQATLWTFVILTAALAFNW